MQVENEYGSYAKDSNYMAYVKTVTLARALVSGVNLSPKHLPYGIFFLLNNPELGFRNPGKHRCIIPLLSPSSCLLEWKRWQMTLSVLISLCSRVSQGRG